MDTTHKLSPLLDLCVATIDISKKGKNCRLSHKNYLLILVKKHTTTTHK